MAVIKGGRVIAGVDREDLEILQKYTYRFARDGGAIGAITLLAETGESQSLPLGYIPAEAWYEAVTTPTSGGGATIALGVTSAPTAILAATAFGDASFVPPVATLGSKPAKSASDRSVLLTIATATLTAGDINVYVRSIKGETAV